jgi:RimJ/RimL family protein N-acetyltransferase
MPELSDLDLLRIEVDTIWARDDRGRLSLDPRPGQAAQPYLVIACGREGRVVGVGAAVPDGLANELSAAAELGAMPEDLSQPPEAVAACEALLRSEMGAVARSSGPAYFVPPETRFEATQRIVRAGDEVAASFTPPAEANWTDEEWRALVSGELGPFAFGIVDETVTSICHCSRIRAPSAEAGVWTHPAFRGRGLAASVTAAWARLVQDSGRIAFYSTSAENRSSQRVAARLGLRGIGWMWTLSAVA